MRLGSFGFAVLAMGALACGGKTADGGDASGGDGGPGPGPGPTPFCPQAEPSPGSSCSKPNLECEYGGDPRTTCNDVLGCVNGKWEATLSGDPTCPSSNSPACPPSQSGINVGGVCGAPGAMCNYSTSAQTEWCGCTFMGGPIMLDGGDQYTWQCGGYTMSGCPAVRPRLGTTCAQPDLECDYSICGAPTGLSVRCEGTTGTWVTGFGSVCAGAN